MAGYENLGTTIALNDGMSKPLNTINSSIHMVINSFTRMQQIMNRPMQPLINDNFIRSIETSTRLISQYENQLNRISGRNLTNTVTTNLPNWNNIQNTSVINSSGSERLQREMNDYRNMVSGINNLQDKLKINIGSMDRSLLPQNAISDITHAETRVNSLLQSMQRMSKADMSMLNTSQIESMNSSFESMRQNASSMISAMSGINSSLTGGNINEINSGFQQLNSLATQAERQIRSTGQALSEINSTRNWNSVDPFQVMQGDGKERLQREIDSYKNGIEQINNLQSQFNLNSSSIRSLLPPNAITDIEQAQNRVNSLIQSMQGTSGVNMSALNPSQIDSMSNVFEGLRRRTVELQAAMSGIGNNISTNNVDALNSSFQRLNALTEQTETQLRNTSNALSGLNANNTGTGQLQQTFENYKRIIEDINRMRDKFNSTPFHELIPQDSIRNATRAEGILSSLASTIRQVSGMNVELLNPSQVSSMQSSFDSLRRGAETIQTAMSGIGTNVHTGNIENLNNSFFQLGSLARQAEHQIRITAQAVNAINNSHWKNINGGQELFNSTGQLRTLQEMSSLNQMFQRLKQSQDQITQNATKMSVLPPNAQRDFDLLNSRVYMLSNTIRALEREKGRLSRFDISGINNFNNRIEGLRNHLHSALSMQERINTAISSSNFENVNRGARELNDIVTYSPTYANAKRRGLLGR